jgi:hypothetical protein
VVLLGGRARDAAAELAVHDGGVGLKRWIGTRFVRAIGTTTDHTSSKT